MVLTVLDIYEIEEKELPLAELVVHSSFSHVVDKTNNVTGAICSIYFYCPDYPTGYMFVGVGKIKELPPHIEMIHNPYYGEGLEFLKNKQKRNKHENRH
jgi:hypothetical protein